jgi:phosphoglycolate phosphatase-like HAD superfamily hydrolase
VLECIRPKYLTAIATNRGLSMPLIIEEHGLGELFDMIVTTLDVRNPKPDPECLLKILEHFKAEPDEALYIGDSEVDRLVSEGANVHFASYKNPHLKAAYHFNDHMDLLKVLPLRTEIGLRNNQKSFPTR